MSHIARARLAVAAALLAVAFALIPADSQARGPLYGTTYPSKITGKLWSGVGNILFCWVEWPIEINKEIQNTDPFTGSVVGFFTGLYYTGRRLVIGVVDVVTFPVDVYGNNYSSVQRTDFPFIDEID